MNIFVVVQECWEEDPKLLVQTVIGGAVLGLSIPILIILAFVM